MFNCSTLIFLWQYIISDFTMERSSGSLDYLTTYICFSCGVKYIMNTNPSPNFYCPRCRNLTLVTSIYVRKFRRKSCRCSVVIVKFLCVFCIFQRLRQPQWTTYHTWNILLIFVFWKRKETPNKDSKCHFEKKKLSENVCYLFDLFFHSFVIVQKELVSFQLISSLAINIDLTQNRVRILRFNCKANWISLYSAFSNHNISWHINWTTVFKRHK